MSETQKVTVHLPRDLLQRACAETGKGLTATVRDGLQLLAARQAYRQLRALRGKVDISTNLDELRADRA